MHQRSDSKQNNDPSAARSVPWKRIFLYTAIALAAVILLFFGIIGYLIAAAPDIDLITVSPTESATYICDEEGNYLRKLTLASSNRDIVTLDQIPDSLQKAVIAIEDERFYEHGGIDVRGILRAFWSGVTSGSFSEGASTITQQLIKNNVFTEWTQENSFADRFRRKIQEQYLALQLEDRISKNEILEDYLNTINLGAGCYGVQSASRRYFGKDVSELSLAESAVLAAIPQNPSGYNPITNAASNQKRQKTILTYMQNQGYISEEERQAALEDDVYSRIQTYNDMYEEESVYSYYEDALIDQVIDVLMEEKGYTSDQAYRAVFSGGLRIFSAQDQEAQKICDEEFLNPANFPEGTEYGVDYALSVSDANGLVTHYGSESLRSYIRKTVNPSFDLLCASQEEAQQYADLFRASIFDEMSGTESEGASDPVSESGSSADSNSPAESGLTLLGERLSLSPQPQASVVLMDQKTGYVRAIVGGRGEKTASLTLNRATETLRQPGSTFKILTAYAPAIDAFGKTLADTYKNERYNYEDGTPVSNWDITDYSGTVTIREAILRSINVIAVKCITEITPRVGFDYAEKFGISSLYESYEADGNISSDIVQPLALGGITQGVSNLELCGAYAAIANGGAYIPPRFFTKILDRHGEVLIDYSADKKESNAQENASSEPASAKTAARQVISPETAFLLTDAMRDVVSSPQGTAYGSISAASQPVAGKTGTTSNYKDIWFAGYTPYYTCCVWGGYDNNQELPLASTYHVYNKILWSAIMNRIHAGLPAAEFSRPDTVQPVTLCRESHLTAVPGGCPETYTEYFAKGTEPKEECPLHEPQPETEPIVIYPDIFESTETESESETDSESAQPPETEPSIPELSPSESETPPDETDETETDSSQESETLQTETNSLDDLMNRLISNYGG
ncbi:MAG: transglycosylase domain-containing protein [Lachnospiraceae bacterium]|nr:transglycosylase domain-containing protein [Lachnospiraceae bacterium]